MSVNDSEKLFTDIKEKGIALKVMMDNFDPNKDDEILFMKTILIDLNKSIDEATKIEK